MCGVCGGGDMGGEAEEANKLSYVLVPANLDGPMKFFVPTYPCSKLISIDRESRMRDSLGEWSGRDDFRGTEGRE